MNLYNNIPARPNRVDDNEWRICHWKPGTYEARNRVHSSFPTCTFSYNTIVLLNKFFSLASIAAISLIRFIEKLSIKLSVSIKFTWRYIFCSIPPKTPQRPTGIWFLFLESFSLGQSSSSSSHFLGFYGCNATFCWRLVLGLHYICNICLYVKHIHKLRHC